MSEEERVSRRWRKRGKSFRRWLPTSKARVALLGLDPWQCGAFALHTPGQIGFIDTLGQREGRIHFAGEHTSVYTGWMQGALESARRVTQEINA